MKDVYKLTASKRSTLYIWATEDEAKLYLQISNNSVVERKYKMKLSEPENWLTEYIRSNCSISVQKS